ncbi:MAG: class I SAM-dependent methyltransferase [Bacteroidales bacterium]|nr:class I SAM-dependent methyltransferase [Bacteroidales bacterium]
MNEFDHKAATWDANPMHAERAKAVAQAIREMIPLNKTLHALEYGCGTAQLSFELKDDLKDITLMDSSFEMIEVVKNKIAGSGATNLFPLFFDFEKEEYNLRHFDLIYTQMVLHHVSDTEEFIKKFFNLLNGKGFLAVADLYLEDGSFHDSSFTGHKGFDPEKLMKMFKEIGFSSARYKTCFTINKSFENGETKNFPVFLLTAFKDLFY